MITRVKAGDGLRILAKDWNAIAQVTDAALSRSMSLAADVTGASRSQTVVLCQNSTDGAIDRFSILGIDAPVITPAANLLEFQNNFALSCVTPTDDHAGRFVIALEPAKKDGFFRGCVSGVCVAQVLDDDVEAGQLVDVDTGETTHLIGSDTGVQVLWIAAPDDNTPRWAVIRIGGGGGAGLPFFVRLTGSTSITTNRWTYTGVEATQATEGQYTDVAGGWSGNCYNTIEANNGTTGVVGSGDNVDDFPAGVVLQPIGVGAVVAAWKVKNCDGDEEVHFCVPNNPGGACDGGT